MNQTDAPVAVATPPEHPPKGALKDRIMLVVGIILCCLFIPVLIVSSTLIVKSYTTPEHIPDFMGYSPVVALSGSMEPLFATEDLVLIKDKDTDDLVVGDVICFLYNETTAITHRIIAITYEGSEPVFHTQGDANNIADSFTVSPDQIEGVYVGHREGWGAVVLFAQTTMGMILFIGVPITLYLVIDLLVRRKESKADRSRAQAERDRADALEAELAALRGAKGE